MIRMGGLRGIFSFSWTSTPSSLTASWDQEELEMVFPLKFVLPSRTPEHATCGLGRKYSILGGGLVIIRSLLEPPGARDRAAMDGKQQDQHRGHLLRDPDSS